MKYSSISSRLNRLEQKKQIAERKVKIAMTSYGKWTVLIDHENFNTLAEAVDYVKSKYNTHSIKVCQVAYVINKMPDKDLKIIASLNDQPNTPEQDKLIRQIQEPCDQLQQVQQHNPKIHFELFYMTNEEQNEIQQHFKPLKNDPEQSL